MGLAAALMEAESLELPTSSPSVDRLVAMIQDLDAQALRRIQHRQLALLELAIDFARMSGDEYYAYDLGLHLGVAESLVRTNSAITRLLLDVEHESDSSVNVETLSTALGESVTCMSVAYNRHVGDLEVHSSASLNSILSALATGASLVPSSEVRDVARCVRFLIAQRLQFSLSDAAFLVRVGVDRLPEPRRRLLQSNIAIESGAALADLLVVGYPRLNASIRAVGMPEHATALDSLYAFRAQVASALIYLGQWLSVSPLADEKTRRSIAAEDALSALAGPLWMLMVALACSRTVRFVRRASKATLEERQQFSRVEAYLDEGEGEGAGEGSKSSVDFARRAFA
jgi:hypothetical protein